MENYLKTAGSAAFLALVVLGLLLGAAGGATAADVEIANDTVSIDNDTRSVYADVAAGENSSVNVSVTFRSVENGNLTADVNETRTVSLNASESQLVERSSLNTSAYDSVRVTVDATGTNTTNATAEVGKVAEVAGSGGGVLDGSGVGSIGTAGIVVVVLLGALMLTGGDD